MEQLAIHGGTPVRTRPFPARTPFGDEERRELDEALARQDLFYSAHGKCAEFEKQFAALYGVRAAHTCASGTSAVHIAVASLNLQPGDEIILSPVTDFGSVAGILYQGLIPVFADWKEGALNTDPEDIERKITPRTRAILLIHLFGTPHDMDAVTAIAKKHGLYLIEDCAQSYLATWKGRLLGTFGDIGCFSMQMSKHLATGEGGVVISDNQALGDRMQLFRDKGFSNFGAWGPRAYSILGLNYRMNELTGAVAVAQLGKLRETVSRMRGLGGLLSEKLGDLPGILPMPVPEGGKSSRWLYACLIRDWEGEPFIHALRAEGIPASWGYTVDPIYLCSAALLDKKTFGDSAWPFSLRPDIGPYARGLCPVAERELRSTLTMRIESSWSESDIDDVSAAFHKVAALFPRKA